MNIINKLQSDSKSHHEFEALAKIDDKVLENISGGLIGPDQNLNDFPRWIWPVIQPVNYASMLQPQSSQIANNLNISKSI